MIKKSYIKFFAAYFLVFLLSAGHGLAADIKYPVIKIAGSQAVIGPASGIVEFARYLFLAGTAIGFFAVFFSLLFAGVTYFLSVASAEMRNNAKDRFMGAMSGLLILATTYLLVTAINPQLAFFRVAPLPPGPPPPLEKKSPGVYFFTSPDCSGKDIFPHTAGVPQLGTDLTNRIRSVGIIKDLDSDTAYISILYNNINFKGKCQYLDPNLDCQQIDQSISSSASIYAYDFQPNGDGVYIFRKSFFNKQGGFLYIPNAKINGYFEAPLEKLKFQNVPEEEQVCAQYDKNGQCVKKELPSLAGENITSIKINGNYVVLLSYAAPGQSCAQFKSDSCQIFPTPDDINKTGPAQIKWEQVRNYFQVLPNCISIFPVKQK